MTFVKWLRGSESLRAAKLRDWCGSNSGKNILAKISLYYVLTSSRNVTGQRSSVDLG